MNPGRGTQRPPRLLTLSPNVSIILFALGADELVVGRTSHCLDSLRAYLHAWRLPESAFAERLKIWEALPVAGSWPGVDVPCVEALRPELVLTSGTPAVVGGGTEALGLPTGALVNFDVRTLAELDRQILSIGELVGKADGARQLVAALAESRQRASAPEAGSRDRPKVLLEYCVCIKYRPDPAARFANPGRFVMVGGHLAPELIRLAGGEPLFTRAGDTVSWIDFERIREAEPDVLLAFDCGGCPNALRHPVSERPGWPGLRAVASGAVHRPRLNIANPNLCHPAALAELVEILATWDRQAS